jgi:hypothetical protein
MAVQDTVYAGVTPKALVDPEETQRSLIALRDELWERKLGEDVFFKINTCLYKSYPETYKE